MTILRIDRFLALALAALLAFPHYVYGTDARPTITLEQFSIGGVSLGRGQIPELLRAFGPPLEIRSEATEAGPDTATVYVFEGAEAYTQGEELLNLRCTSAAWQTPDGVRVGDSPSAIFEIYRPTHVEERGEADLIRYHVNEFEAALLFHVADGRVSMIELWWDYL